MIIKPMSFDGGSPKSRKIHLIVAQVVLISITMAVVALRIYARAQIRAVGTDDWLIILALVMCSFSAHVQALTCYVTVLRYPLHGVYLHIYHSRVDISPERRQQQNPSSHCSLDSSNAVHARCINSEALHISFLLETIQFQNFPMLRFWWDHLCNTVVSQL